LSGYAEEEVVGQPLTFLYADELRDPERFRRELDSVRATGRRVEDGWRIRKNGTRLYVRSVRTPVLDRKGRICGFAVFTHDVTEHQALEAQLLQAQKLESLGTLAGGIAHDFNNMLMVISSRAELLLRLLGTVDPYRRFIEDIQKATGKSRNLTQQLLAAARRQVLQPSVTNVNEVVKSSLELLSPTLGEHILINSELSEPLWSVYADPGKLHQVLLNLAINARDAMSAGGTLTIETRNLRVDAAYARQHPGLLAGEYVALIVSDTGTGIPAEIRERIYDPFFSTKALGSGLGMAVVRGIIEQTGGFIWLYSEEGKGTTFKIVLPRHVDVAAGVAPTEAEALPEYGVETILLVEDEQLLRTVLRETLEEHGYTVIDARSPAEALAVTAPVHLLLTDVVMPGMNGPTLAAKLVAQRPELRVVFMSGYTDDAISHHGVLDHGVYFLEKPSTTAGLLRTIRAALSDE
jgi:PAS domain S-box-containing protein